MLGFAPPAVRPAARSSAVRAGPPRVLRLMVAQLGLPIKYLSLLHGSIRYHVSTLTSSADILKRVIPGAVAEADYDVQRSVGHETAEVDDSEVRGVGGETGVEAGQGDQPPGQAAVLPRHRRHHTRLPIAEPVQQSNIRSWRLRWTQNLSDKSRNCYC